MWPGSSKEWVWENLPNPFCSGAQASKWVVGERIAQRACDETFGELVVKGTRKLW